MSEQAAAQQVRQPAQPTTPTRTRGVLQRACACGKHTTDQNGECAECRKKRLGLQRRAVGSGPDVGHGQTVAPPIVHEVLRSPGRPLDDATRGFMESRFNHDFSGVRVHTDGQAAESARAVNALAYTVGNHVAFGAGQYVPGTITGQGLLAHELNHTLQQRGTAIPETRLIIERGDTAAERESHQVAENVGKRHGVWSGPAESVHLRSLPHILTSPLRREVALSARVQRQELCPGGVYDEERRVCRQATPETARSEAEFSEEELAEAGLLAVGYTLQFVAGPEAQVTRDLYNQGAARLAAERARMIAQSVPEEQIARRVAQMRHELAIAVRRAGSAMLRQGAELIDSIRGQARPTYESLRAAGKTNAQIIESASRTNRFVNRLPAGLRWTGRALWFVQVGVSVYIVVNAPPEMRDEVAQREVEGIVGGIGGAAIGEAFCILAGIATEGLGLVLCAVIGGGLGFGAAREFHLLQLLDIVPHEVPSLAGTVFRLEGTFGDVDLFILSIPGSRVTAADNALVVATGRRSGEQVSGRGHYRSLEVVPSNNPAVRILGGHDARFIPQHLLVTASREDLIRSRD